MDKYCKPTFCDVGYSILAALLLLLVLVLLLGLCPLSIGVSLGVVSMFSFSHAPQGQVLSHQGRTVERGKEAESEEDRRERARVHLGFASAATSHIFLGVLELTQCL